MQLSSFQKEKLQYYFKLYDSDGKGFLELKDLDGFMKKVLNYTKWSEDDQRAKDCRDVHKCFLSTVIEKTKMQNEGRVDIDSWLEMWSKLIPGSQAMSNFPFCVQLLPKCLFKIIDSKADGKIDEAELCEFYTQFVGMSPDKIQSLPKYAMDQMTDRGRYPLTVASYDQIFANFLIGKTTYGAGRFIFGCFEHMVEPINFRIVQEPPEHVSGQVPEPLQPWTAHNPKTPTPIVKVKFFRAG